MNAQVSYAQAAQHLLKDIVDTENRLASLRAALRGLAPLVTPDELKLALADGRDGSQAERFVRELSNVEVVELPAPGPAVKEIPPPASEAAPLVEVADAQILPSGKKTRKNRVTARKRPGRKAKRRGSSPSLPKTGGEFWLGLMGKSRRTTSEILAAAMKELQVPETERKTVLNRLNAWLYPAIKREAVKRAADKGGYATYQVV